MIEWLAGLLAPDEREVVLGDLAESGARKARALRDVAGLVVRRQADAWKHPAPWLVFLCIVLPLGMLLNYASRSTADSTAILLWVFSSNWDTGLLADRSFGSDALLLLVLACWAWTIGVVIASLSRRATPSNAALFCLLLAWGVGPALLGRVRELWGSAAVFQTFFYRIIIPVAVQAGLVIPAALGGLRNARRHNSLITILALGTMVPIVLELVRFPWGWAILRILCCWPIAYWLAAACMSGRKGDRQGQDRSTYRR